MASKYNPKLQMLSDEDILIFTGANVLTTWKDTNLRVDKELKTISGGPLDPKIFGSCFSNQCNCGRIRVKERTCGHCRAKILDTEQAWTRYARIDLPLYICHNIKKKSFIKFMHSNFNIDIQVNEDTSTYMEGNKYFIWDFAQVNYNEEKNQIILTDQITDHTKCSYDGLLNVISTHFPEKLSDFKSYINSEILVVPLIMRAPKYGVINGVKQLMQHKLTLEYVSILNAIYYELPRALDIYTTETEMALYNAILRNFICTQISMMSGIIKANKESFPRTMQAHRLENSGRCTIVPSPELKIDEIKIPRHLIYECYQDEFIEYMMVKNKWTETYATLLYRSSANTPEVQAMFSDFIENGLDGRGKYVIINRNPTLYELGMACCKIKLTNDYTIGLPLALCSPFGGDFDGDTFSFYAIPKELTSMCIEKMSPANQFRYKKNLNMLYTPSHEVMAGLIVGTRRLPTVGEQKVFNNIEEAEQYRKHNRDFKWQTPCIIDSKLTTLGRAKLSELFNGDIDEYLGDRPNLTSSDMQILFGHLADLDDRTDRIQQIQEFSLKIVTISGLTVPKLSELHADLPTEFLDKIRKIESDENLTQEEKDVKVRFIYEDFLKSVNEKNDKGEYVRVSNDLVMRVSDSSRAKVDQLMTMMVPLFNVDPQGEVSVGVSSLIEGMSPTDYINMAIENRVTQDIKVSSVPRSGYTTRQLEYLGTPYKYSSTPEGESNEGIKILTKDALGRTMTDGAVVTEADIKAHPDRVIKVRSIVTSKSLINGIINSDLVSNVNHWEDGASIGVSIMTSLTEGLTQQGLSLKHGGHLFEIDNNAVIYAKEDVTLTIDDNWIILKSVENGNEYVYPKSDKFIKNYVPNDLYKKGEMVGVDYRLVTPSYRLDCVIKLIGAQSTSSQKRAINNKVLISQCYAFNDGIINYVKVGNKCSHVTIGNQKYTFSPDALYFYPDGTEVKAGQRICTGVLDLRDAISRNNDYIETFYLFRKQFNELIKGITSELIELVYALIISKKHGKYFFQSIAQSIGNSPGSLNKLAFRNSRAFFEPITHEGIEFIGDALSDSLLPSLFINDI